LSGFGEDLDAHVAALLGPSSDRQRAGNSFNAGNAVATRAAPPLPKPGGNNGKRATFKTVSPKLYVEFLDDISNYLLPGAVPPPTR
jgi:hypothetical protein